MEGRDSKKRKVKKIIKRENIKIWCDYWFKNEYDKNKNLIDNKKKLKFKHRTVIISMGFDLNKSTNNRHFLESKYIFVISTRKGQKITKKEFGKSIITALDNNFIGYINKNLKLIGDGATYIKSTTNYLKIDYIIIIDKWHPLGN